MTMSSLFSRQMHPFVWTTPDERAAVLANADDPLWHRFLEEVERHFAAEGGLRLPRFPVFCHDGDLDEVMALAVLAYVRNDARYWQWIADWLRAAEAYFRASSPGWNANLSALMRGEPPGSGNPRQWFEGFTRGGLYWVESGLMSCLLHLLDLIEAYAPARLSLAEKEGLGRALGDFSARYAFHEESVKYSNRGIWANAGLLLAAIADPDAERGAFVRYRAAERHRELRATFFDDGMHAEGSPDYHLMAADGLLCHALPASHLEGSGDVFGEGEGPGPFGRHPSFVRIAKAYLRTALPGPVPWNLPRGCSVSVPVPAAPALLQAYRLSGDPEIAWFLRGRLSQVEERRPTPLRVTKAAGLGLGQYQPLLNFWLYRPLGEARPPARTLDVLPDHGALVSRSGWDAEASCLAARFGYEGTGKGHRDFGHVLVRSGERTILGDPFPRFGPKGIESSLFHNTVTLDRTEPVPVVGRLRASCGAEGIDVFLLSNSGGNLPARDHLHDPREESNYWFTQRPREPDHDFHRLLVHLHGRGVIGIDAIVRRGPGSGPIDWFFHTPLRPDGYDPEAPERAEAYLLQPRSVTTAPGELPVVLRGPARELAASAWQRLPLGEGISLRVLSLAGTMRLEMGHHATAPYRSGDGIEFAAETDYFTRCRIEGEAAQIAWMADWNGLPDPRIDSAGPEWMVQACGWALRCDFAAGTVHIEGKE